MPVCNNEGKNQTVLAGLENMEINDDLNKLLKKFLAE